jgi:hypothetical protein
MSHRPIGSIYSMANQIILKRSSTPSKVPTAAQLALGEIAINTHDGRVFIKKDDGTPSVVEIGGVTSINTHTGDVVLSTSDIAEGSAQYFTNARARSALSAGTGISYNSSTGAISTTQNLSTAGSPTFAGLTLTGNLGMTGSIIPSANNTYSLGSPTMQWKDLYVGPGTLYVNGKAVISDTSGTMTFSTDVDQNMRITTTGTGVLQLGSSSTNVNVDGTLQMGSGKRITDGAGVNVQFGNAIHMNSNKITNLGTPSSSTDAATKAYVDSTVGALSTSAISQGNSNIAVVDNGTGTVTVTVDGNTALTVDASGVVVSGNMTVNGTTTTVNSNTISLADNILTLNSDTTGAPTQNAGIEVERGDEANVQLRWNEGSQKWTFTNDGAVYYPMAVNTDGLAEGSTSLYFTNTRARNAINASSATGVSYNSASGLISLGSIPNSSLANNSISINGASVALGGSRTLTTDDVADTTATNKYFTNAQARSAVSASGSLSYNSTTGVFSYTTPTTIASLSNHTTTNLAEGTNLYYTDARAVSANTSAIATAKSEAISAAATDATSKVAAEATARASAVTAAIATAAADATSKVAAEATARDAAIAAAVAGKDNTDEITEGTTNLYFTNARARGAVSASGDLSYNGTTGVFSFTQNKAWSALTGTPTTVAGYGITNAYTKTEVDSAISTAVAGKDNTDEITEGTTNLYFTNARARGAVSAGTGISYNSTTGVITNTITQYTDAAARSAVSASGSLSYNSTTGVFSFTDAVTSVAGKTGAVTLAVADVSGAASTTYVDNKVAALVAAAPAALDTLNELAAALGNDSNFATTVTNALAGKLSTSGGTLSGSLTVNGAITATGEITAYYSDARLKTNVSKIDGALDKVMAINGYTYDSSDLAMSLGLPKHMDQIGLMADEVEAVLPELVTQSGIEGYKTIRYDKVVSVLVNAIKEQQAMIEELRKDVKKTLH